MTKEELDRFIAKAKKDAEKPSELIETLDKDIANRDRDITFWKNKYIETEEDMEKDKQKLIEYEKEIAELKICIKNADGRYSSGDIEGFKEKLGGYEHSAKETKKFIASDKSLMKMDKSTIKRHEKSKKDLIKRKEKALKDRARYIEYLNSFDEKE